MGWNAEEEPRALGRRMTMDSGRSAGREQDDDPVWVDMRASESRSAASAAEQSGAIVLDESEGEEAADAVQVKQEPEEFDLTHVVPRDAAGRPIWALQPFPML